jgi:hypothetical protein
VRLERVADLRRVFFGHISYGIGQDLSRFADLASYAQHALFSEDHKLSSSHAVLVVEDVADAGTHRAARRRYYHISIDVRLERSDLI